MLIILIFVIMLVLGIIFFDRSKINENLEIPGYLLFILGSGALFASLIIIIIVHSTADKVVRQNKINYDGLCKRYDIIESEYEDISKSDVIADITEWNVKVYNVKYWTESLWTNWFNPKIISDNLEYIPLE